ALFLIGEFFIFHKLLMQRCQQLIGIIARSYQQALLDILLTAVDRLLEHPLDFLVGEPVAWLDIDGMFASRTLIAGSDVKDAVGIDQKRDLDPRHAGGLRSDR